MSAAAPVYYLRVRAWGLGRTFCTMLLEFSGNESSSTASGQGACGHKQCTRMPKSAYVMRYLAAEFEVKVSNEKESFGVYSFLKEC